jgi:hypothetical protein
VARVQRPGDEVTFRKLTLTVPDGRSPGPIRAWQPMGDSDLVLAFDLFVMRRPGVLERLLDRPADGALITSPIYDGRYVWVVLAGKELAPCVIAIDPQTKQQWRLAGDVPIGASIQIAALGPGEVFACGSIGRAWCSVLRIDPARGVVERRVHEARRVPDTSKPISQLPADVTFKPQGMNVVRDRDGKPCVLVQRSVEDVRTSYPTTPLLIDPQSGKATVLPETAHPQNFHPRWTSHDGMLRGMVTSFPSLENPTGTTRLITARLPDLVPRDVLNPAPRGSLLFAGDRVHIVGQQWFVAERFEGPYRALSGMVPQSIGGIVDGKPRLTLPYVFESRHYGFVVLADEQYQVQSVFQAVLKASAGR